MRLGFRGPAARGSGPTQRRRLRGGVWRQIAGFTTGLLLAGAAPATAQDSHVLVIVGVGGDEEHSAKFTKWAGAVVDAAKQRGVADANILYLGERTELDAARMKGRSTRDAVIKAFTDTAARARANDDVFVLLIGHGSFDGRTAAFNLPGPDLTADDYKPLLDKLRLQRVAFINTASSSGAFLEPLAGPGRSIVTATRTGGERNEPRFAEFFVEAYTGDAADRDRNGRISVQEAFDFAKQRVTAEYEKAGNLLSEHAALNDGAEGKLAAMQFLAPQRSRSTEMANADPALRALVEQRDAIEREVAEWRLKKDSTDPEKYEAQLEKLLTDLALKTRQIRDAEAKK